MGVLVSATDSGGVTATAAQTLTIVGVRISTIGTTATANSAGTVNADTLFNNREDDSIVITGTSTNEVGQTVTVTIADSTDPVLRLGDLTLDEESYEVRRGDRLIELTATEFELLRFLMRNPRRVVSKIQILDRVWSYDFGGRSSIVEIYISYLRKKIDAGATPMIHTVRGVGYLLKAGV